MPAPSAGEGLPLFVENVGQFAPPARFLAESATGYTWLAGDAVWMSVFAEPDPPPARCRVARAAHRPNVAPGRRSPFELRRRKPGRKARPV